MSAADSRTGTSDILRLLQERKQQQEAAGSVYGAYHDFQFQNQIRESGILFRPQIVDDVGRHNKPVHYDHGMGLAVADVDGDGLLDVYFVGQLGGSQLWRNLGEGRFEDITKKAGVGLDDKIAVAPAFADVDNDGDQDLFVTSVRTGNTLLVNNGQGVFKDMTAEAGLSYVGHSSGAVFFDYNRDGLLDLFVCNVGRYTSDQKGRGGYYVGLSNAFSGHLFAEMGETSLLYENQGQNRFKNVTDSVLSHSGWSGDACFWDLNEDGYPELYVLNMQGDDAFYFNIQGRRYQNRSAQFFPKSPWGAMGIKFFDFNNDGLTDLYLTDMHSDMTTQQILLWSGANASLEKVKSEAFCVTEWTEDYLQGSANNLFGNAFYLNQGRGKFAEVSDQIGAETFWPWGISVADLNADGFEDVFVTSGMGYPYTYSMNALLLNDAGRRFVNAELILGVEPRLNNQVAVEYFLLDCDGEDKGHPECAGKTGKVLIYGAASSRSSVIFDCDNDGDLDIFTNEMVDRPQILISDLAKRRKVQFVKVRLAGRSSNRDGLGARVQLVAGGTTQTRYHDGKSGYLAQSASLPLYFGLPNATSAERLEVWWPSGKHQILSGQEIPLNDLITVREPE